MNSDEASFTAGKGWGSRKDFKFEDWSLTDADFEDLKDDEILKQQLAEDAACDEHGAP